MDMTIFKDIVELAKAGYKPADVKELMTLMKQEPDKTEPTEPKEPDKTEPDKTEPTKALVNAFEELIIREVNN